MKKKYEFVDETKTLEDGTILHRIKALRSFGDVKAGDLGRFIEKEKNLSHEGDCWIFGNAKVFGDTIICDNANISKTSDYMVIGPIGSRNGYTTFYKTDNNTIYVKCGCFNASIDKFETRVQGVHGNNKHAINYNKAIDLAKTMINNE